MKYKAIVTDLDGALLNPKGQLSPETSITLQRLNIIGVNLIIATGRHPKDAQNIFRKIKLNAQIVGLNGALTLCNHSGDIVNEYFIKPECIEDILLLIANQNIHVSVFDRQGWKLFEVNQMSIDYASFAGFPYIKISPSELFDLNINKLVLWCDEGIASIEQEIRKIFDGHLECYRISAQQLEIGPSGISKATTVSKLLASQNIFFERDAIAFGDGANDIEMLRHAAMGILMGNASQEIKAILPHILVAPDNENDGVAHILKNIFLLK